MIAIAGEKSPKSASQRRTACCLPEQNGVAKSWNNASPPLSNTCTTPATHWHAGFLKLLPGIQQYVRRAFWQLDPEARDEAITEAVANALVSYVRLVKRNRVELACPTVLARFAVAQQRDGRRVGSHLKRRDVLSGRRNLVPVERLDRWDADEDQWREAVVADSSTPVADQVAFRLDFSAWLALLTTRNRRVAKRLALGHNTVAVARRFGISPGRVSQLRQELRRSWRSFQGQIVE